MAKTRRECTGCKQTWTFEVGDEEKANGEQIVWECPDFECATKNIIDGKTPAELALERIGVPEEGVRQVTDGDEGTTGDDKKD